MSSARRSRFGCGCQRRLQRIDESEQRLPALESAAWEMLAHETGDLFRADRIRRTRSGPAERQTLRLELAQLVEEEIILTKRVCKLLRRPPEQRKDLIIRQQMPVAPDDGEMRPATLRLGQPARRFEAHTAPEVREFLGLRSDNFHHALQRNERPISPDKGMHSARKPSRIQRRGGGAHREDRPGFFPKNRP